MRQQTRDDYEERIVRAQLYIHHHLDDDLSLEKLASISNFSPFHFHRIFNAMTGESVKQYIRRIKLERAALEVRHTRAAITTIAFRAGYETHEAFTRAFKGVFGASPSKYRSNYHNTIDIDSTERTLTLIIKAKGTISMNVKIENLPKMTVASARHVGAYKNCCQAWQTLCSEKSVMSSMATPPMFIGICYDDPDVTEEDNIRYDACITVNESFQSTGMINKQTIKGGKFAILRHTGSYNNLHNCYRQLYGEWLPQSGYEPKSEPSLEIYRNSPEDTPEDKLITDICIPLQ